VAAKLKLSPQTIRRYVLKRDIPFLKIRKVIRFRPSDIERWAENGGLAKAAQGNKNLEGDLFAATEAGETAETETDTKTGEAVTESKAGDSGEVQQ
jgi:excisionase family DNA binding protein